MIGTYLVKDAKVVAILITVLTAMLAAGALALVAERSAEAAFPGKNGKIAYNRAFDFWAKNASLGSPEAKLLDDAAHLTYSPDGSRIAFMRTNDIYVANADGSGTPRNITNSPLLDWNPAWSHDGTRIAFLRRGSDNIFNIWTMNADGTDQEQLTTEASTSPPAWSVPTVGAPDGKIAFARGGRIWTMLANGDGEAELQYTCPTENGGVCDRAVGSPTFSPDGSEIAAEYFGDIFMVPSGGGTARLLLSGSNDTYPGQELDPAWSPDGTKIAFEHNGNVPGSFYGIYMANADGSSAQAIQITSKTGEVDPDWQQDSIPPNTAITSGPPNISRGVSASFAFVSSETGSTFQCSLDGAAFSPCASPKSHSAPNGSHTFRVRATDAAGNVDATPAARAWTVDTIKPAVSGMSPRHRSVTRDITPTVKATVRDNLTNLRKPNISLYVAGKRISKFNYSASTNKLVYTSPRLPKGRKAVKVVARDAAGNVSARAWHFTIR